MEKINEYMEFLSHYQLNTINYTPLYIVLGFLFLNYVIAFIKSKKNSIIAISGWADLIIVLSPIFGFIIYFLIEIGLGIFKPELVTTEFKNKLLFYYLISFATAIIITLIYSITANRNNVFNIFFSFFAKLFIMAFSAVLVLIIIVDSLRHKKDNRTKDGSSSNTKTASKIVFVGIAALLIYPLVSHRKYIDVKLGKIEKEQKELDNLLNQQEDIS